jgi:hypothetical protein
MWRLKTCPKCSGDLYAERYRRSWAEQCLQCGYAKEHEMPPARLGARESARRLLLARELGAVTALSRT